MKSEKLEKFDKFVVSDGRGLIAHTKTPYGCSATTCFVPPGTKLTFVGRDSEVNMNVYQLVHEEKIAIADYSIERLSRI